MRKSLLTAVSVLLTMMVVPSMAALPKVDITGVNGGSHWIWVEAEDADMISQGGAKYCYGLGVSGFADYASPSNFVGLEWTSGAPTIQWLLHMPAAMNNPKIQLQAGAHLGTGMNIDLDGANIGKFNNLPVGEWGVIAGWTQAAVSSIAAGDHLLQLQNWQYDINRLDGILLYDGDISVSGHPNTSATLYYNGTQYWMGANMAPNSRPVINAASVTPNFSVAGVQNGGVNYYVDLDGTVNPYVQGTALTEPGVYRVWAEAWGEGLPDSTDYPSKRIIVGVDFILNNDMRPKPSVEISGLNGAAHWLWLEAEDAASIKSGRVDAKDVADYSGYRANDVRPANRVIQEFNGSELSLQWKTTIPAAMGSGYKVIPHCSSHYGSGRLTDLIIDGVKTNTFSSPQSDWGDVPAWMKISVPSALSTGVHTIRFEAQGPYEIYSWDGILLYDGDITTNGYPTLVSYPSDTTFIDATMIPVNHQVISASSVTPVFNVSGTENGGVSYWISKDGAEKIAYIPGTPISGDGFYRVWAEAWAAQWDTDTLVPQKRILAGADFELQGAQISSIKDARTAVDGTTVAVSNALVSASYAGYLYIQDDKVCGIRVEKAGLNVATPARVNIAGTIQTNSDGERYIAASSVVPVASTDTVVPVGLNNKALGGGDFNYVPFPVKSGQEGVDDGSGLNNIGLLVKVWGKVSPVDSTMFKITDGSGVDVYVESLLGGIPTGTPTVAVTGASSCKMIGGKIVRIIRVDDPDKIEIKAGT